MAVDNSIVEKKKQSQPKFSVAIQSNAYKNLINKTLGEPNRAKRFVVAVSSAVAVNPMLQECDAGTILSAALLGESLNLSPSPQLGQYYLVPFNDKKRNCKVATFQIGYKGYIQLAIRSGYYKKINVLPLKFGEVINYDPLTEEIEVRIIEDEEERENAPTVGYYAFFEYLNGFTKAMYWSKNKMLKHADKYSPSFNLEATNGKYAKVSFEDYLAGKVSEKDMWLYSSFWYKDFDGMACKTMLRQLISKWGIMSTELQTAFENDMGVINENGQVEFVDNKDENMLPEQYENTNESINEPIQEEISYEVGTNDFIEDDFFNN
ncbi:recombinase [Tyzzerella sp. An114]|uniref:recombinase RecT n=1 Tax=Tyzzerella sp. An114 TaxID=1965545 RepID=UPI000B44603B|nr:recombinase RecT [Tyzzerella sp. An114]OUQ56215.1 recombinase [Tyzzerella sp. An114]